MKKKLIAFISVACMFISALPPAAFVSAEGGTKSENFMLNSDWLGSTYTRTLARDPKMHVLNMIDGSAATTATTGQHPNNYEWWSCFDLTKIMDYSDKANPVEKQTRETPVYNKAIINYAIPNVKLAKFIMGDTFEGTGHPDRMGNDHSPDNKITEIESVTSAKTFDMNASAREVFSFDKKSYPLVSLYIKTGQSSMNGTYIGKHITISELELFYVTPDSVTIEAPEFVKLSEVTAGSTITPAGSLVDVDGDPILDSEFAGLTWSVSGSDAVSIDESTGVVTLNSLPAPNSTITVRAAMTKDGYTDKFAETTITFTNKEILSIELGGLPDFIMTNPAQTSESTFTPDATAYGLNGEVIENPKLAWSLKEPVDGIKIDSATGKFTVDNTVTAPEFTLVCKASNQGEDASSELTVKLNEKVDLVRDKLGWTVSGWQVAKTGVVGNAVDGDSTTQWNSGNHSRGTAMALYDIGRPVKANYFRLNLGNTDNSTSLRIAGSTGLVGHNDSTEFEHPTTPNQAYNTSSAVMPVLSPRNGNNTFQGTTYWSARSESAAVESAYEQENVLADADNYCYFRNGTEEFRYIGIINFAKDLTANAGVFTVSDFEVYNTAPNYTAIALPENVDISASDAVVKLEATVHNGVAAENATGTGTWSATGFNIDAQTGDLHVASTTSFILGTVTYNYSCEGLASSATIYVCAENGTLKFANDPNTFLDMRFGEGVKAEGSTLYVPADTTAEQLYAGISSGKGNVEVYVVDKEDNDVESGPVEEGYTVWLNYNGIEVIYQIKFLTVPAVDITKADGVYTASSSLGMDVDEAVLVIAEYNADRLVQAATSVKSKDRELLTAVLNNVSEGNVVKAMLFDSLNGLQPLCQSQTK